MVGLIKLLGIIMVTMGAMYLVKPDMMKKNGRFWIKKERLYLAWILKVSIGALLLLVASRCSMPGVIATLGILEIIKAVIGLMLGPKKVMPIIESLIKKSPKTLRAFAVIILVLGALIIYAA